MPKFSTWQEGSRNRREVRQGRQDGRIDGQPEISQSDEQSFARKPPTKKPRVTKPWCVCGSYVSWLSRTLFDRPDEVIRRYAKEADAIANMEKLARDDGFKNLRVEYRA